MIKHVLILATEKDTNICQNIIELVVINPHKIS